MDRHSDERTLRALAQLPQGAQRILRRYHFEGKRYEEIAAEEGILVETAKSRVNRARQRLKSIRDA